MQRKYTPDELKKKWREYKESCDSRLYVRTEFSQRESKFISGKAHGYITYTIEGFCVFLDLSRQAFYEYYTSHPDYVDIVTRMREECEMDQRAKFEMGAIPSKLAGMWMSRYEGYREKQEIDIPDQKIELTVTDPNLKELSE